MPSHNQIQPELSNFPSAFFCSQRQILSRSLECASTLSAYHVTCKWKASFHITITVSFFGAQQYSVYERQWLVATKRVRYEPANWTLAGHINRRSTCAFAIISTKRGFFPLTNFSGIVDAEEFRVKRSISKRGEECLYNTTHGFKEVKAVRACVQNAPPPWRYVLQSVYVMEKITEVMSYTQELCLLTAVHFCTTLWQNL